MEAKRTKRARRGKKRLFASFCPFCPFCSPSTNNMFLAARTRRNSLPVIFNLLGKHPRTWRVFIVSGRRSRPERLLSNPESQISQSPCDTRSSALHHLLHFGQRSH